jgi:hypothetical protein
MGNKQGKSLQGKSSSLSPSHQVAKDHRLDLNPDVSANTSLKQEQQNEPQVSSSFGDAEKTQSVTLSNELCPRALPAPHSPPPFRMLCSPVKRSGSQKKLFIDHLQTIPFGPESVNKVSLIRLIHKSKFIAHPIVQDYLQELLDLFDHFRYHRNGYGGYVMGFSLSEAETKDNLPLKKPKMSMWAEGEALGGGIPVDELYEENKPVKVQTFRKQKSSIEYRKLVESLLFWRDDHQGDSTPESDQFCEIFPLDNCPDFTFVSHRWAANGRALGKHLELLLFLALSKEDYIWLDCCCSPQDPYSLSHGHTMQVIWNIGDFLSRAKNISSYYFIDGIDGPRYEKTADEVGRESDGAVFLYHLLYPETLPHSVRTEIEKRNFQNANRLWCVLERRLGGQKMLSSKEYDRNTLFQVLNRPPNNNGRSPEEEKRGTPDLVHRPVVDDGFVPDRRKTNCDIAEDRINYYHAKHQSSLDCFSATDIEPVTRLLFQHQAFPFYIKEDWPRCGTVHDNELKFGIRLPDPEKNQLYGWYYFHADDPVVQRYIGGWFRHEEKAEKYYFMCHWPSAPHEQCKTIRLQVHVNCLKQQQQQSRDQKREFLYHPNEGQQLAMCVDNERSSVSCLLCSK